MANGGVALTPSERKLLGLSLSPAHKKALREKEATAQATRDADKNMQAARVKEDTDVTRGLNAILKRLRGG